MAVSAELPRPAVGGIADDPIFKFRDTQRMAYLAKREQSGTGRAAVDRRFRWTPDKVVAALRERLQGNFAATRRAFRAIDRDCAGSCDAVRFRGMLAAFNVVATDADFATLWAAFDKDASGNVDFRKFLARTGCAGDGAAPAAPALTSLALDGTAQERHRSRLALKGARLARVTPAQIRSQLAHRLAAPAAVRALRKLFAAADPAASGAVSPAAFRGALAKLNLQLHDDDFAAFLEDVRAGACGDVDYGGFLRGFGSDVAGYGPEASDPYRARLEKFASGGGGAFDADFWPRLLADGHMGAFVQSGLSRQHEAKKSAARAPKVPLVGANETEGPGDLFHARGRAVIPSVPCPGGRRAGVGRAGGSAAREVHPHVPSDGRCGRGCLSGRA